MWSPVVVAIDGVKWLDDASARALEFAVRRLPKRVGVLATVRSGTTSDTPFARDRAVPQERLSRVVMA